MNKNHKKMRRVAYKLTSRRYADGNRSGAFVLKTPDRLGIAIRRQAADPKSGYTLWQLDKKPFVVASPQLDQITQPEFADRVNHMARIHDVRSMEDVINSIEHVLMAAPPDHELESLQFNQFVRQVASQIACYADLLERDLASQDAVVDIATVIRQAVPCAIRGYMRGYYPNLRELSKVDLNNLYRNDARNIIENALSQYNVDFRLIDEISELVFDEVLSARISILSKRFIVAGFSRSSPRVHSFDLDGYFAGHMKASTSEYGISEAESQSFFLDAGDCYEVGRFACGVNSAAHQQSLSVTESLLQRAQKKYAGDIGMWNNLEVLKPTPTDVATLALKSVEFNAAGLFSTPLTRLMKAASPPELLNAMQILGRVADLQDELLGMRGSAWFEAVILDRSGVVAKSSPPNARSAASPKKAA